MAFLTVEHISKTCLARRVVVLREGFVTGELPHEKFSQEAVLELMA